MRQMKAKKIAELESYFKTGNVHWDEYALKVIGEVLRNGKFKNPVAPIKLIDDWLGIFLDKPQNPLQLVTHLSKEMHRLKFSGQQKLFIYQSIRDYFDETEIEGVNLRPIQRILEIEREKLNEEIESEKPKVKKIRETLEEVMQREFEQLPETLKGLQPVQRLTLISKLAPYVLGKIENAESENKSNWLF